MLDVHRIDDALCVCGEGGGGVNLKVRIIFPVFFTVVYRVHLVNTIYLIYLKVSRPNYQINSN